MNKTLFCIVLRYESGVPPVQALDAEMQKLAGQDWLRINFQNYFAWTTLTAEQIYNAVKHLVSPADSLFIMAMDPTKRFGWAPQWVWNWFDGIAQIQTLSQHANPMRNPPTGTSQANPFLGLLPPQK